VRSVLLLRREEETQTTPTDGGGKKGETDTLMINQENESVRHGRRPLNIQKRRSHRRGRHEKGCQLFLAPYLRKKKGTARTVTTAQKGTGRRPVCELGERKGPVFHAGERKTKGGGVHPKKEARLAAQSEKKGSKADINKSRATTSPGKEEGGKRSTAAPSCDKGGKNSP